MYGLLSRGLNGGTEENGERPHLTLSMFQPGIESRISRITTACAVKVTEKIVVRKIRRLKAEEETVEWR